MKGVSLPLSKSNDGEEIYADFLQCYKNGKTAPVTVRAGDVEISYEFEADSAEESGVYSGYDISRIDQVTSSACPLLIQEVERSHRLAAERSYPKHGILSTGVEMCGTVAGFAAIFGLLGLIAGVCAVVFGVLVPFELI